MKYVCKSCANKIDVHPSEYVVSCPWCGSDMSEEIVRPTYRWKGYAAPLRGRAVPLSARYVYMNVDGTGGKIRKCGGGE